MRYWLMLASCIIFIFSCTPEQSGLKSTTTDEGIEIAEGDIKVLFYQVKPKSLNGKFERASYIHPLYNLNGNVVTEDFPEDHPHHHGVYSAWHQIIRNDTTIGDGWTGDNISWTVVNTKARDNDDRSTITSEILWNAELNGAHTPIAREFLEIVVYAANEDFRVIDHNTKILPLTEGLKVGGSDDEKGYGGFSFRLKLPHDIRFLSKEKEVEAKTVSVDAGPWLNFVGSFDGPGSGISGMIVFSHPSNPGHPQPWILRKEKSMQNVAYPGRTPVDVKREGISLRYRMIIHKGGLNEVAIADLYSGYMRD